MYIAVAGSTATSGEARKTCCPFPVVAQKRWKTEMLKTDPEKVSVTFFRSTLTAINIVFFINDNGAAGLPDMLVSQYINILVLMTNKSSPQIRTAEGDWIPQMSVNLRIN